MLLYFVIQRNRRNSTHRFSEKESRSAPSEAGRLVVCFPDNSERKLAAELPESRLMGSRRLAKSPVRQIGIGVGIVCPVEEIEHLKPELKINSFPNPVIFVEVEIRLRKIWSAELHGLLISIRATV
jgi:hypothetical protein